MKLIIIIILGLSGSGCVYKRLLTCEPQKLISEDCMFIYKQRCKDKHCKEQQLVKEDCTLIFQEECKPANKFYEKTDKN